MFRLNLSFALRHKLQNAWEALLILFLADLPSQSLSFALRAAHALCVQVSHEPGLGCFESPTPTLVGSSFHLFKFLAFLLVDGPKGK